MNENLESHGSRAESARQRRVEPPAAEGPPPFRPHLQELAERIDLRVVYVDLDGTLLGPGGSLFAAGDGPGATAAAARALAALAEAGVEVVPVSGRTREQMREIARLLGARTFVAELGGLVVRREGGSEIVERNWGAYRGTRTPYEAMQGSGVGGLLLEAYRGRLEPHAPWAFVPRETSMLLRGQVDTADVDRLLERAGFDWLELLDNGIIPARAGRFPDLRVDAVRAYHLVPRGVSKRAGVALDRERRGLPPDACIAVGDSRADAGIAPEVAAVFIVANGARAVAGERPSGVYLTSRPHGEGFAEIALALARRPTAGA